MVWDKKSVFASVWWVFVNDQLTGMRKKAKPSLKNLKIFLNYMLCFFWEILTSLM